MKEMNYVERTIFLCNTMSTLDKRQQNALKPQWMSGRVWCRHGVTQF